MAGTLVGVGYIRVDADTKPATMALKALGGIGKTMLATTMVPLTATLTAGVASMAASFAEAGAAGGAFGAAVIPQFKKISDASQKYSQAQVAQQKAQIASTHAQDLAAKGGKAYQQALTESASATETARKAQALYKDDLSAMPPATRQTATAFQGLKDDFNAWSDSLSGSTMPIFTVGIEKLRDLLPKLTPVVKIAAGEFKSFLDGLGAGTSGKVFQEFGSNLTTYGGGSLHNILDILKNVVVGFVGVLNAFTPMSVGVSGGLDAMTKKFANWGANLGKSQGFATFIKTVRQFVSELGGPQGFGASLADLGRAAVKVGENLGPLAGVSLKIASAFASVIAATPVPVLTGIATAFIAFNLTSRVLELATAIKLMAQSTLVQAAATRIATAASWLWTAAMSANPITIVVIAIAALVAAIVVIATKTDWFQKLWKATWGAIQTAFFATWNFIKDHWKLIVEILGGPIGIATVFILDHWKQITNGFNAVITWIRQHWVLIVSIITGPIGAAALYVIRHWNEITAGARSMLADLTAFFRALPGKVSAAVGNLGKLLYGKGGDIVSGLLSGARSGLSAVEKFAKDVKNAIVGAIKKVFGINSPARVMMPYGGHIMSGLFHGMLKGKSVLNNAVKGLFSSPLDAAKSLLSNGVSLSTEWLGKLTGGVGSLFGIGGGSKTLAGKSAQDAINYAAQLVSDLWPNDFGTQMLALKNLWMGESGWNYTATNASSGAYGIPQALPASKMASAGSDWKTNPATQIKWGLDYIVSRYGKPSTAFGDWSARSPHWYDDGGWLPPGLSLAMNGTGKPERIRTAGQEAALGGGGTVVNVYVDRPLASKRELQDLFVTTMDDLKRQHRL